MPSQSTVMTPGGMIQSSRHLEHELKLQHKIEPYICNRCGEWGHSSGYKCSTCNFPSSQGLCNAFPHHHPTFLPWSLGFQFRESSTHPSYCDACGRDIKGFEYHCFEGGWDLHPICAALPQTLVVEDSSRNPDQVHQKVSFKICMCAKLPVTVEGELKLELRCRKKSIMCYKCGKKYMHKGRNNWSYVSPCGEYQLHVACVMDMLREKYALPENCDKELFVGLLAYTIWRRT